MNRHPAAEILALWTGADLDRDVTSELGLHLEGCAECRRKVEEIKRAQELLAASFEEPSEADLLQVRVGLRQSLEKRRLLLWCWSLAGAAAALVLATVGVTHRSAPVAALEERTIQLPPFPISTRVALEVPDSKQIAKAHLQRRRTEQPTGLRAVNFVSGADGSTLLRLTTADPNVIILLPQPTERTVEQ